MSILDFLAKVPSAIWVLLGAIPSMFGVWFTNHGNNKRLTNQLNHDADQRDRERFHALRREVYLNAAQELVRANAHLGKLAQLDPAKEDIGDGLTGFQSASAKLQLIAHTETASYALELSARYGEAFLRLSAQATPIYNCNVDIKISTDFYDRHQAEVSRVLAEMAHASESGQMTPDRFAALERSFEWSKQQADKYAEDRAGYFRSRSEKMAAYMDHVLVELKSLVPLQIKLITSIRGELGLTTNAVELEDRLHANYERMEAALNTLVRQLKDDD